VASRRLKASIPPERSANVTRSFARELGAGRLSDRAVDATAVAAGARPR